MKLKSENKQLLHEMQTTVKPEPSELRVPTANVGDWS